MVFIIKESGHYNLDQKDGRDPKKALTNEDDLVLAFLAVRMLANEDVTSIEALFQRHRPILEIEEKV